MVSGIKSEIEMESVGASDFAAGIPFDGRYLAIFEQRVGWQRGWMQAYNNVRIPPLQTTYSDPAIIDLFPSGRIEP